MRYTFEEEFRLDHPTGVGEIGMYFYLDSYKDWLEDQLIEARKQLALCNVVGGSGKLNIAEHQESVIKSLNDLKKRYPNKTDYRITSNCRTIQYFVDNELVYQANI